MKGSSTTSTYLVCYVFIVDTLFTYLNSLFCAQHRHGCDICKLANSLHSCLAADCWRTYIDRRSLYSSCELCPHHPWSRLIYFFRVQRMLHAVLIKRILLNLRVIPPHDDKWCLSTVVYADFDQHEHTSGNFPKNEQQLES